MEQIRVITSTICSSNEKSIESHYLSPDCDDFVKDWCHKENKDQKSLSIEDLDCVLDLYDDDLKKQEEAIDDKVDEWHSKEELTMSLPEYLGMTVKEYEAYVKSFKNYLEVRRENRTRH